MTIWRLAWRSALRRRRLFAWNIAVPLVLLAPVALSEAAAPHRVAVFGVFLVFFGAFGSAIPVVRDARDGWLDEVLRAGYPAPRWLLERTLAGTAIDTAQLLPVLLVLLWSGGGLRAGPVVLIATLVALWFANLIGPLVAAAVRSLAEAALASAALSLLLLHLAGFFRTPVPGWSEIAAAWNPYAPLRVALGAGVGAAAPADPSAWARSLLLVLVVTLGAAAFPTSWSRRLRWPRTP
ncbi:ABC transporter permease [Candidatus Palauibacter sp.]|uniref:ABC transporter permease n=1 Tax=Candidatus Palauibacter sp. TaxID=3101350 RepID=UPI003B0181FC